MPIKMANGTRLRMAAITPPLSAERNTTARSRPATRRSVSCQLPAWIGGGIDGEVPAVSWTVTFSDADSLGLKRTWGTPHSGQKGDESGTGDPQRWQGCSTAENYHIAPDTISEQTCLACPTSRRIFEKRDTSDRVVLAVRVDVYERELRSFAVRFDCDDVLVAFCSRLEF